MASAMAFALSANAAACGVGRDPGGCRVSVPNCADEAAVRDYSASEARFRFCFRATGRTSARANLVSRVRRVDYLVRRAADDSAKSARRRFCFRAMDWICARANRLSRARSVDELALPATAAFAIGMCHRFCFRATGPICVCANHLSEAHSVDELVVPAADDSVS
jgi:hypothetical protein